MFSITRFYQIKYDSLCLRDKHYLSRTVRNFVLGSKVSKILIEAAKETFTPILNEFEKALGMLSAIDVAYYDVDTQFCLDINLFNDEKEEDRFASPDVKLQVENQEHFDFMMVKSFLNNSTSSP